MIRYICYQQPAAVQSLMESIQIGHGVIDVLEELRSKADIAAWERWDRRLLAI